MIKNFLFAACRSLQKMKITLGRTVHGPFTISVSFTKSRIIGACMENQRPILTPLFLNPIMRTLKTGEGKFPKIQGVERGGGRDP